MPRHFPIGVDLFAHTRDEMAARAPSPPLDAVARSTCGTGAHDEGGPPAGSPPRRSASVIASYFSSFSISSMIEFISAIALSNGFDVVMSTPASLSRSIGYLVEPLASIFM